MSPFRSLLPCACPHILTSRFGGHLTCARGASDTDAVDTSAQSAFWGSLFTANMPCTAYPYAPRAAARPPRIMYNYAYPPSPHTQLRLYLQAVIPLSYCACLWGLNIYFAWLVGSPPQGEKVDTNAITQAFYVVSILPSHFVYASVHAPSHSGTCQPPVGYAYVLESP